MRALRLWCLRRLCLLWGFLCDARCLLECVAGLACLLAEFFDVDPPALVVAVRPAPPVTPVVLVDWVEGQGRGLDTGSGVLVTQIGTVGDVGVSAPAANATEATTPSRPAHRAAATSFALDSDMLATSFRSTQRAPRRR